MFIFASYSHAKHFIVSFSNSLNKLNVSTTCYEAIPIDIAHNFEFTLSWMNLDSIDNQYITMSRIIDGFKER